MDISLPYTRLTVTAGSRAHGVYANQIATIISARNLGAEHSHCVRLVVQINGLTHAWYVRHQNRLNDGSFNAHKGDPTKKVTFQPINQPLVECNNPVPITREEVKSGHIKMTRCEAAKQDRSVYTEFDEDLGEFGVFGEHTGFCYFSGTEQTCNQEAEKINSRKGV